MNFRDIIYIVKCLGAENRKNRELLFLIVKTINVYKDFPSPIQMKAAAILLTPTIETSVLNRNLKRIATLIQFVDSLPMNLDGSMELDLEYIDKIELGGADILMAPGTYLSKVLRFVYSKKSFELIFLQILADGREEYFEALFADEKWKAKWRHVQIYLAVLSAIFAWTSTSMVKKFATIWKML